jgi:small GTP-binding protein
VKLQIWRASENERFMSITRSYLRNAVGVILMFDLTDRKLFDDLSRRLNEVRESCDPNVVVTLVGNKSDLIDKMVVSQDEAENFAQVNQLQYLEISILKDQNIHEMLRMTAVDAYYRFPLDPDDNKRFIENHEDDGKSFIKNREDKVGKCW